MARHDKRRGLMLKDASRSYSVIGDGEPKSRTAVEMQENSSFLRL